MNNCPWCKEGLNISTISIASTDFFYGCIADDHQYRECYDLNQHIYESDILTWIELEINGTIYYGNEAIRICKLHAFS